MQIRLIWSAAANRAEQKFLAAERIRKAKAEEKDIKEEKEYQ